MKLRARVRDGLAPLTPLVATLLFAVHGADANAQAAPRDTAFADALVLSGGGARGIAHAGALVGLERAGFSPELVVGTSMGAIVGALYAAGLDAEEVWRVMEAEDWQALFDGFAMPGGPTRRPRRPLVSLGLRTTELRPIDGLIRDVRINRRLLHMLFEPNMRARGDFDRLPRRYRAVGADLEDGEVFALARGDLARAVRVSMAVPGVFAPVVWDGRVLVDGGIADNLPVDIAAGADRIVAVDVIRPERPLGRPNPLIAGLRGFRLTILNAVPDTAADVLIRPEIPAAWSAAAFPADATPLLRLGLAAALAALPAGSVSGSPARPAQPAAPPEAITAVSIDAEPSLEPIVRAAFDRGAARFDADAVLDAADRLYATGLFAGVWAAPLPYGASAATEPMPATGPETTQAVRIRDASEPDDSTTLYVRAESLPPLEIAAAAGYGLDRGARGWLRGSWRPGAGPLSFASSVSYDGEETVAAFEAGWTHSSFAPLGITAGGAFLRTDIRFAETAADRVDRSGGWIGVEYRWPGPDVVASVVARAERIDLAGERGHAVGPQLRIERIHPASRPVGGPVLLEAEIREGEIAYRRIRFAAGPDGRLGPLRVAALVDLAATGGAAPPDVLPALGDDHAMPGLRWGDGRAATRAVVGGDIAMPASLGAFLRLRLRAGAATAELDDWLESEPWLGGAALEVFWHTLLGEIVFGAAAASNGERRFVLQVGSLF